MLHVGLHGWVGKLASNQTLGVKDSVGCVHGGLRLGGITNKTFSLGEGNITWGSTVTLIAALFERWKIIMVSAVIRKRKKGTTTTMTSFTYLAIISTRSFCQTPTQE
jgi:hypothetical protein